MKAKLFAGVLAVLTFAFGILIYNSSPNDSRNTEKQAKKKETATKTKNQEPARVDSAQSKSTQTQAEGGQQANSHGGAYPASQQRFASQDGTASPEVASRAMDVASVKSMVGNLKLAIAMKDAERTKSVADSLKRMPKETVLAVLKSEWSSCRDFDTQNALGKVVNEIQ